MASTIRVWNGNQYKDHTLEQFGKTRIFIGSGSYCDIVIKAQGIEEQHGILLNKDGEWFYQDADSMSGTFMNGNRVSSQKLAEGNVLVFGELKGENTVCLEVKSVETKGAAEKSVDSAFASAAQDAVSQSVDSAFSQTAQSAAGQSVDSAFVSAAQGAAGQKVDSAFGQTTQGSQQRSYGQSMQNTSQPSYGQNMQNTSRPAYGQNTQNTQQPPYGQNMQNTSQPVYGQNTQGTQQPSYGQGMQNISQPSYGQNMQQPYPPRQNDGQQYTPQGTTGQPFPPQGTTGQPFPPQRNAGQQYPQGGGQNYPPQNRQPQPPQNNGGSGKKTGLIIGIISGVAVIAITLVVLFATGVFGGKKEETASTMTGKVDNTEMILTTEAITETPTAATELQTEMPTEISTETTEKDTVEPVTEATTENTDELDSEEIYKIASPSTVEIQAFNEYYGSQGSGFFDDDKGTVVTNYHVIEGTYEGTIITSDKKKYNITGVLGYDANLDIAILSTDIGTSVPLTRKTDKVVTGEKVYALGSSQGYSGTFTEGIVSTAEREEDGHIYIQHSAPITNGNSGGPLLDKYGHVMGINNWVRTDGQNLNFAIPIDQVDNVSRSSSMTLAEVYAKETGTTSTASTTDFGNGKKVILDSLGGLELQITVPEFVEVNEETGEAAYMAESGDTYLSINGAIEDNMEGGSLEDMSPEIMEMLEEFLKENEEDGVVFEDLSSSTLIINKEPWYIYTTYGYFEDEGVVYMLDVVFLVGYRDGKLGFIQMIAAYLDSDNIEKNYENIANIEEEMISSIKF